MKTGIILFVIGLVIAGPLLIIWSLNTLFNCGIPTTLATWAATAILASAVYGSSSSSK